MVKINELKHRRLLYEFLQRYPTAGCDEKGLRRSLFKWEIKDELIYLHIDHITSHFDNPNLFYDGEDVVIIYFNPHLAMISDLSCIADGSENLQELLTQAKVVYINTYNDGVFYESYYMPVRIIENIPISL